MRVADSNILVFILKDFGSAPDEVQLNGSLLASSNTPADRR